jgi:small subunit ribosomal protein S13
MAQTEVRMYGVNLPINKKLYISLSYLYGVGQINGKAACKKVGVDPEKKTKDLTDEELNKVRKYIDENYVVEGDLKGKISSNVKLLIAIGCYRGLRHRLGLPARGQNTKRNARTRKGKKKAAIANKKKVAK